MGARSTRCSSGRLVALLVVLAAPGCVYTKAPCFPGLAAEGPQRLATVEYSTDRFNPEDGETSRGRVGYRYCSSPPCTLVGEGEIHLLGRAKDTWITMDYLRVYEPDRGIVQLTHTVEPNGTRIRLPDGRGHRGDLTVDVVGLARLYGLGKGDLIGLTVHEEGSPRVERYYFEYRHARGDGLPDRLDADLAVGVLPIPEVAVDLEPPRSGPRERWDVAQATFPLALQVAFGWNTVSRDTPLAEFADRLDLVLALAVVNFQGLPSGLQAKTSPTFGPGIRIHRIFNLVWYFDLFGQDPVGFPALAVSVDEGMRVASSLLRTDTLYKSPRPRRFRVILSGDFGTSTTDMGRSLVDVAAGWAVESRDQPTFPGGHLSFGRVWGDSWTFPQVDLGVVWIPQEGSDDDLVFLQLTAGPRADLHPWGPLGVFTSFGVGVYEGYLLKENETNEARMRSGFTLGAGLSYEVARNREISTWDVQLASTLHGIHDFAGSGAWSRFVSLDLGISVEF